MTKPTDQHPSHGAAALEEGDGVSPPQPPPETAQAPGSESQKAEPEPQDAVEFMLERIDSIELWRATTARLNLVQIGASLVRGVVRRGRLSAPPMHVFGTHHHHRRHGAAGGTVEPVASASAAPGAPPHVTQQLQLPPPHAHTPADAQEAAARAAQHAVKPAPSLSSGPASADRTAADHHGHYHAHGGHPTAESHPSVARRALVRTVSRASVPLYMGMLSAFIAYGVPHVFASDAAGAAEATTAGAAGHAADAKKAAKSTHTTGQHLRFTPEMHHALHELHRAAAEVSALIASEASDMHALATTAMEAASKVGTYLTDEEERAREVRQAQLSRSCRRLSRVVANLYSVLALLDFFAVEGEPIPTAAATTPSPSSSGGGGGGFMAGLSSTVAAIANIMAEHGAMSTSVHAQPAPRSAAPHDAAVATPSPPAYTVARFNALFEVARHLPQSVWKAFSVVATTLSHFGVPWSLTINDKSGQAFNGAAAAVLGEDQRCLLLQLHRLCTRFAVLRQRVFALHPMSPLYYKVKQMLEWGGLFNADAPDAWSSGNGDIDRCDLHQDPHHNTYARGRAWAVSAANRKALKIVASSPYTEAARSSALRRLRESSAFTRATGDAPDDASASLSLLASLASAGTRGAPNAAIAGLLTAPPSSSGAAASPSGTHLSTVPGYVGLRNTGNTCFLNSVVQLLSSATCFRDDLLARVQAAVFGAARQACSSAADSPDSGRAPDGKALEALFAQYGCRLAMVLLLGELQWRGAQHQEGHPVLPDYLTPHLPAPFDDHRQHDASEFWHALMAQLDVPNQPGGAVVAHWFCGRTTTAMTCVTCRRVRRHTDAFWDISTPLSQRSAPALSAHTVVAGGAAAAATSRFVSVVEVDHFDGATAVTTTYACAPSSPPGAPEQTSDPTAPEARAEGSTEDGAAEELADSNKVSASLPPILLPDAPQLQPASAPAAATSSAAEGSGADAEPRTTLQHLLLRVLHPTLNKELLQGSNALDCEHCHRRTDTELTTRLVADVSTPAAMADEEGGASSASPSASAATAAGGGLPFYLAVQLNRFAYRRDTQSYAKITDGVLLNEVVLLPVFADAPPAPVDGTVTAAAGDAEEEEEPTTAAAPAAGNEEASATQSSTASLDAGPPAAPPVWVAYRLRTIIIHSGPTPSSGHYFTLTKARATHATPSAQADEEASAAAAAHADDGSALPATRAYVDELGAVLARCLRAERHFSFADSDPPATLKTEDGVAAAPGSTVASAAETPNVLDAAVPAVQSPALSPAPPLPAAAASVSGDRLYDDWVMLNDSNVQAVEAATMRRMLQGEGGGGVYSAMETPYIILYEKLPFAYTEPANHTATPACREADDETVVCARTGAVSAAALLHRAWEGSMPARAGVAAAAHPDTPPAPYAAEVLHIFASRLKDEAAHSRAGKSSSVPPRPTPVGTVVLDGAESSPTPAKATVAATTTTGSGGGAVGHVPRSPLPRRLTASGKLSRPSRTKRFSRPAAERERRRGAAARASAEADLSRSGSEADSEAEEDAGARP